MKSTKRPVNSHQSYHAHIYFDTASKAVVQRLRDGSAELFGLQVGRMHERLLGPHPCWSCQVNFTADDFERYIPWLDANRQGLTILIHGRTGNAVEDHTDSAYWLGEEVPLNLDFFKRA